LVENIFGGSGADTFDVTAVFAGNIDAGAGNDIINLQANVTGGLGVTGGADDDTININEGVTVAGTLAGGLGNDTLVLATAAGGANTWHITGTNSGDINGGQTFQGMESVTGNSDSDTFEFADLGRLIGTANGGPGAVSDTLDFHLKLSSVSVVLSGIGTIDGFRGDVSPHLGGFDNINVITGSGVGGNDSLTGFNATATWDINGTTNTYTAGGRTLVLPAGYTNLNGGAGNDIFNITATVFGNVAGGAGDDTFGLAGTGLTGTITGTVDTGAGDDRWNFVATKSLASNLTGTGTLTIVRGGGGGLQDMTVDATDLNLPVTMTGFTGHMIIGGVMTPPTLPFTGTTTVVLNADRLTVNTPVVTGGAVTLLAANIDLGADITAGAPGVGGGTVTMYAFGNNTNVGGGSPEGDITALVPVVVTGSDATLVANNAFVNSSNITLELGGGEIRIAKGAAAEEPQFQQGATGATGAELDTDTQAFIAAVGLNVQQVLIAFSNPGAALAALEQLVFLDIGLFEQELTLFGVIGNGIAMQLSQCEEAEGCAPSVTPEQLVELIAGIDGRIAELERRKAAGEVDAATADRLIAGYQTQLAKFKQYQAELDAYLKEQQEAELEDLGEDLGGEEPSVEGEEVPVEEEAAPAEETQAEEPAAPEEAEEPAAVEEPATPAPQPAAAPEEPPAELEEQIDDTLPEEPAVQPEPPAAAPEAAPPADLPSSLEENLEEEEVLIDTSAAARLPLIQAGVSSYQWFAAPGRNRVQWVGDIVMPRAYRQY